MKTIGIIGGISWLSSLEYYRLLNEEVNKRLGGVHSAKIILYSVNFAEIKTLTFEDRWDEIASIIKDAARRLERAGADCVLIGANTMHKIADGTHLRAQSLILSPIQCAKKVGHQPMQQVFPFFPGWFVMMR